MPVEPRKNKVLFNGLRLRILSKREFKGIGILSINEKVECHCEE
jgi:hypothetical protein